MIDRKIAEIFFKIAPGSPLRVAVDDILDGTLGALIVVGYDDEVQKVIDGGFFLDCPFTPEKLFELCKMDGAIITDEFCTKILYANVHLQINRIYPTEESGTRHRTAQRAAQQLDKLIIAVSERKKVVNLYKGKVKYKLKKVSEVNEEANQALRTLEKYRNVIDKSLVNMTILELDDLVTVYDVASTLQRFEMIRRIEEEIAHQLLELGSEGRLIGLQLEELTQDLDETEYDFINDFKNEELEVEDVKEQMRNLTDAELLEIVNFAVALGYSKVYSTLDNKMTSKGNRILGKISKLSEKDIEKITSTFSSISEIQDAEDSEFLDIKLSRFKIKALRTGLQRLKFTVELEK